MNFIAAWLSTLMIVDLLGDIPSSVSNSQIQRHSQVVLLSTMYSVSIIDSATVKTLDLTVEYVFQLKAYI